MFRLCPLPGQGKQGYRTGGRAQNVDARLLLYPSAPGVNNPEGPVTWFLVGIFIGAALGYLTAATVWSWSRD